MALNKKDLVFGILYIVLAKQLYLWLANKGLGVHFNNHNPGNCRVVPEISCGSKKISVSKNGLAFITNGLRTFTNCNQTYLKGRLFLFDFNNPNRNVKELKMRNLPSNDFLDVFDPHGMDIFEGEANKSIKLFVVNHANKNDTIEVFQYRHEYPDEVQYISTIRNHNFICLSDITLINEDEFYVTNYVKYCHSDWKHLTLFETMFGFTTANILYYKQGYTAVIAHGSLLNGIAHSPDYQYLYCVASTSSAVNVYKRIDGGALKLLRQISVGFFPDNVHVDQDTGHIYVGLHKDAFGGFALVGNQTTHTSASAVKLVVSSNFDPRGIVVREILHDEGKNFVNMVSTAVHYKGQYLFGTIFHKLGFCAGKKNKIVSNSK